jgi:hypothetical protein
VIRIRPSNNKDAVGRNVNVINHWDVLFIKSLPSFGLNEVEAEGDFQQDCFH